jgi:hypothetical protein
VFVTKSAGSYYYRLTAQNESGKQTAPGPTGTFVILLPGPETTSPDVIHLRLGGEAELTWKPCKACVAYRAQVATDPKWRSLLVDERSKQTHYTYKATALGRFNWRVVGEDPLGKRSTPSTTKTLIVTEPASETVVEPPPPPPPEDNGPHFFFGVGHALHWNFNLTFAALARVEGGLAFTLGPGRFLAFITSGMERLDVAAEFPAANVRPTLLVVPATLALGYQLTLKDFRLRFVAFPAVNPAFIVLAGNNTATSSGGLGFGFGGGVALGYHLGPMQVSLDLRVSWAPLITNTLRVQTGGMVLGISIWYEK